VGNNPVVSKGPAQSSVMPRSAGAAACEVVFERDMLRVCVWRNVVIQDVGKAQMDVVDALSAALRQQLLLYPANVVSLALLRHGLQPAASDVRKAMSRVIRENGSAVRHVLVVEDAGVLGQLMITVIRGVILFGSGKTIYSIHTQRREALAKVLPHVAAAPGASAASLKNELLAAIAVCTRSH
jgi:hypothetical protein